MSSQTHYLPHSHESGNYRFFGPDSTPVVKTAGFTGSNDETYNSTGQRWVRIEQAIRDASRFTNDAIDIDDVKVEVMRLLDEALKVAETHAAHYRLTPMRHLDFEADQRRLNGYITSNWVRFGMLDFKSEVHLERDITPGGVDEYGDEYDESETHVVVGTVTIEGYLTRPVTVRFEERLIGFEANVVDAFWNFQSWRTGVISAYKALVEQAEGQDEPF